VHTGTLGFFCDYSPEQLDDLVHHFVMLPSKSYEYPLLEMHLLTQEGAQTYFAINEVRIENPFQTFVTQVFIDQVSLESFRGTGLVISTSLGSSAYNKSLGGALVDVDLKTMQLTEMAPIHNTSYRSLGSSYVLSPKKVITLKGQFDSVIFGYDHELVQQQNHIQEVIIQMSEKTVKLVHRQQMTYLALLHKTFIG
jgi:NAD+ kinase